MTTKPTMMIFNRFKSLFASERRSFSFIVICFLAFVGVAGYIIFQFEQLKAARLRMPLPADFRETGSFPVEAVLPQNEGFFSVLVRSDNALGYVAKTLNVGWGLSRGRTLEGVDGVLLQRALGQVETVFVEDVPSEQPLRVDFNNRIIQANVLSDSGVYTAVDTKYTVHVHSLREVTGATQSVN